MCHLRQGHRCYGRRHGLLLIPFKKAKDSTNPNITISNQYVADGKTSVDWCFSTMPSEEWKNGVGSALTAYAAGTGDWDAVGDRFCGRLGHRI